jgi:hypothetical protein
MYSLSMLIFRHICQLSRVGRFTFFPRKYDFYSYRAFVIRSILAVMSAAARVKDASLITVSNVF